MGLIKELNQIFRKDNTKEVAQEVVDLYLEKKESGSEHPIDTTVEMLMQKIKEDPDPEKIKQLLIRINSKEELPDRVFEKTSTKILETEEIPNRVITEVVKENNEEIADESIDTIIEEGNIELKQRIELIKNVNDKAILNKRIESELQILYSNCKDKRDYEVVDRVDELKSILVHKPNRRTKELIQKIVAKKMAENYYNDSIKGTKIYTLSRVVPVEEMLKIDLPKMVLEEYCKIEEKEGPKSERVNVSDLRIQILDKLADEVANTYLKTGVFVIPQSETMKKLTQEEEQKFINAIQIFSKDELSDEDILNIQEQIHGNETQVKENMLINYIREIPEKDKKNSLDFLISVFENDETLKTISILENSGLIRQLNKMPQNKRKKSVEAISTVLETRKYRVSKNPPKIQEGKKVKIYSNKHEQDR